MEKLFYNRNKKVLNLNLLADSLGRSLRENVTLFSVDDFNSRAVFVTESGFIIEGSYFFGETMILDDILVETGELFQDDEKFDVAIKGQIGNFINNIFSSDLSDASNSFDRIIESWGQRVKFNETVDQLREQSESFNNTFNIVKTKEFERFMEVSENISNFLKDNLEKVSGIPEIVNAIKLSNTVSQAFDVKRLSIQDLSESGRFEAQLEDSKDIYEMICKQELVKKEIVESKKSFETVWATETCISNLASKIFEDDPHVIAKALVEAFVEIPYIALISKKQLSSTIQKNLSVVNESTVYTKNDLKSFVQDLFEMKKPLRDLVSNLLQEKYGVNVNNLKETPTFRTLINTQSIIFESLSKIAPRGSVVKETLIEVSEMLKGKNGVEALDVNEGIKYLFINSGYSDIYDDASLASSFNLNESLSEDDDIVGDIIKNLIFEDYDNSLVVEETPQANELENETSNEEEVEDGMSARELMRTLKEVEDLIADPLDSEED